MKKYIFRKLSILIIVIAMFLGIIIGLNAYGGNELVAIVDASVREANIGEAYDGEAVTPTPVIPESTPESSKEKGCGGSIAASILGLLTLSGAVVILRKKRD